MKKKRVKLLVNIIIAIVIILVLIMGGVYFYINSLLGKVEKEEIQKDDIGITAEIEEEINNYENAEEVKNIALFGIDAVDGKVGRSDCIIILSVNKGVNKVKLSSIMRDSYVNIPGRGNDKINHAYAFGGPQLAIKTINANFNLNVDDFITVDFSSLPKVIDKFGGIDLEITETERNFMNRYIRQVNKLDNVNAPEVAAAGKQHLTGHQALAYSRIRKDGGGDQKRTDRQREVLEALFEQAKSISITEYPSILSEVLPLVRTSMDSSEMLSLGQSMIKMNIEEKRFPEDSLSNGQTINGGYYLVFNKEKTVENMHNFIFE